MVKQKKRVRKTNKLWIEIRAKKPIPMDIWMMMMIDLNLNLATWWDVQLQGDA
jgi:hypothetical protein